MPQGGIIIFGTLVQGKKFRKFRPKFWRIFGFRWRSIKFPDFRFSVEKNISTKISISRFFPTFSDFFLHFPKFSDISRNFPIFPRNFHFFPVFSFCSLTPKISKKCFWRVSNPPKMPGNGTLQPPSHSLHLLYIMQTFFIFSYYLFVHNPYHHLIIIFYFYFTL